MEMINEEESKLYKVRFIVGPGMTEHARGIQMLKSTSSVMRLATEDVWSPWKVACLVTLDSDVICILRKNPLHPKTALCSQVARKTSCSAGHSLRYYLSAPPRASQVFAAGVDPGSYGEEP